MNTQTAAQISDREFSLKCALFQARHDTLCQSSPMTPLQDRSLNSIQPVESVWPGTIWRIAFTVVIFIRAYIEESKWTHHPLHWMCVVEPWWTVDPGDHPRYANLFTRIEWAEARTMLETSLRKLLDTNPQHPQTEHIAILSFVRDSMEFATRMYRMQLTELPEDQHLLDVHA